MSNLTTTDNEWLKVLTDKSREVYEAALRIRRRDYSDFVPPEVEEIRKEIRKTKEKVAEHDGLLVGLFKQMTASFGGMMKLDEKLKGKKQ